MCFGAACMVTRQGACAARMRMFPVLPVPAYPRLAAVYANPVAHCAMLTHLGLSCSRLSIPSRLLWISMAICLQHETAISAIT